MPGRDFRVGTAPSAHLEYVAESRRTGTPTAYTVELFAVDLLTDPAHARIAADPGCRWLTAREIDAGVAVDGRPVSTTIGFLLRQAGLLPAIAAGLI